jgi:protein TonB
MTRPRSLLLVLVLLGGCAAPTGDGVPPLRFVQGAMPAYPAAAKAAGLEGWVRVRYAVGADGAVGNPQVVEAAPEGVFDAAARAAVARWRYAPDPRGLGWEGVESVVRFELGERVLP